MAINEMCYAFPLTVFITLNYKIATGYCIDIVRQTFSKEIVYNYLNLLPSFRRVKKSPRKKMIYHFNDNYRQMMMTKSFFIGMV